MAISSTLPSIHPLTFLPPFHPSYLVPFYPSFPQANDIALVELPQPLNYATDAKIQPICLGLQEDIPFGGKAVASGWGTLSFGRSTGFITH